MPDNITGIMTSKAVFYAMEPSHLAKYANFKDFISTQQINLSEDKVNKIKIAMAESRNAETVRESFFVDDSGNAHIFVTGPLEPKPDICAMMFDIEMTTYSDIIKETRIAEADNNINKIIYHFETPGGNIVGLFAAAEEIRNTKKPTLAINEGLCASAGYALASQCNDITGVNISVEQGSIGVVTEITDKSGSNGAKRYILTSENAENKAPDVTTAEGRSKIIARLTDLESVFVEYVATGRNTTTEDILTNFGRGGILIARDARTVGMIDNIENEINAGSPAQPPQNATATETTTAKTDKENSMEMTAEQLEKFGSDIATKTAATVRTEMTADLDKRDATAKAETERLTAFSQLKIMYPNQAGMIDEESKKAEATADMTFVKKCADSETSRLAAEAIQKDAAGNPVPPVNPDGSAADEKDNSGNELAAKFGLKVGA